MLARTRLSVVAAGVALASVSCGSDTTEPNILTIEAGIPLGWGRVGGTQATYVVGTDSRNAHDGRRALAIGGTDTSVLRFNGIGQYVRGNTYRGKRVRLRAWVRQVGIVGADIGLWMRIDGPGVTEGFDNFSARPLTGTADWHQVEIILDVPADAFGFQFGALMSGRGVFLVDNMTLDVIPATGPTTNQLLSFTDSGLDPATFGTFYATQPDVPINLDFESK